MKKLIYILSSTVLALFIILSIINQTTMKSLKTEITINANPDRVWHTLMDHESFEKWNPFIKRIEGNPEEGKTISVLIQPKGKSPMEFTPKVLVNKEAKEFRWLGHLFVKGLFDGEHFFKLEPIGTNQTKLIHGESFSGLLAGALLKMIGEDTKNGFEAMNEALKLQVEKSNK